MNCDEDADDGQERQYRAARRRCATHKTAFLAGTLTRRALAREGGEIVGALQPAIEARGRRRLFRA